MPSLRSRRLDGVIVGTVATLFEAKSPLWTRSEPFLLWWQSQSLERVRVIS